MNKAIVVDYDEKTDRLMVSIQEIGEYDYWRDAPHKPGYLLMEGKKINNQIMARYESVQAHKIINGD